MSSIPGFQNFAAPGHHETHSNESAISRGAHSNEVPKRLNPESHRIEATLVESVQYLLQNAREKQTEIDHLRRQVNSLYQQQHNESNQESISRPGPENTPSSGLNQSCTPSVQRAGITSVRPYSHQSPSCLTPQRNDANHTYPSQNTLVDVSYCRPFSKSQGSSDGSAPNHHLSITELLRTADSLVHFATPQSSRDYDSAGDVAIYSKTVHSLAQTVAVHNSKIMRMQHSIQQLMAEVANLVPRILAGSVSGTGERVLRTPPTDMPSRARDRIEPNVPTITGTSSNESQSNVGLQQCVDILHEVHQIHYKFEEEVRNLQEQIETNASNTNIALNALGYRVSMLENKLKENAKTVPTSQEEVMHRLNKLEDILRLHLRENSSSSRAAPTVPFANESSLASEGRTRRMTALEGGILHESPMFADQVVFKTSEPPNGAIEHNANHLLLRSNRKYPSTMGRFSPKNSPQSTVTGSSAIVLGIELADAIDTDGLLVVSLTEGGAANLSGLVPGDRIIAVNGIPVDTRVHFSRVLRYIHEDRTQSPSGQCIVTLRRWSVKTMQVDDVDLCV